MKAEVIKALISTGLKKTEVEELIEIPKNTELGDYAFPCFNLSKKLRKNPSEISKDIASKIKTSGFEKIISAGPYVNFFLDKQSLAEKTIKSILSKKEKYGSSSEGKGKNIVIEMSSPNIAKPFGIGHLRSTIIGNSIANISSFLGYKAIRINYLGDWGTQFGKLIVGYKKIGNATELKKSPINYMLKLYIEGNKEEYEQEARDWFKKLEEGDKESLSLWKMFRDFSLKNFNEIYNLLGIKFDEISGESVYNKKMEAIVSELEKKGILEESEGAKIVNLEKFKLGITLIKKNDGATLYITRDLAAAIERHKKYRFFRMFYEVGQEQKLHFNQLFKILELMGHNWAKDCTHVDHGLYLDKDGKKFATRKGKTIFMEEVLHETINLAKKEIKKRHRISEKELNERAGKIARAAIFYGDLKNYRGNDITFDIGRFLSFEGDTGPYLLYSYARANSIIKKAKSQKNLKIISKINEYEKKLIIELKNFPEVVQHAYKNLSPNLIANYSFKLSQTFNEFYHNSKVIDSDEEAFRLELVRCFSQVLKNSLSLLGIQIISKM